MIQSERKQKMYSLCNDVNLTKKDIMDKYGVVSFAYKNKEANTEEPHYNLIAVSKELEPQYLKSDLILDDVFFVGTDTLMDIEEVFGVI